MVQWIIVDLFWLSSIFILVNGKIALVVDDNYEICRKSGDPALFDISNMKIEQYNDTFTYVEGSVKILQNIQSPALVHAYAERQIKGKWEKSLMDRRIPDMCPIIQNPKEVWYFLTQFLDHKECPYPIGKEVALPRVEVSKAQVELQPFMIGNWRLTMTLEIKNGLKTLKDCYRFLYMVTDV